MIFSEKIKELYLNNNDILFPIFMKAPLNIHPPKNWQDFETLCLKLWGEIWKVPHEIEFNSDNSQGQHGVDIYAPIDGGLKYNGIQCKNKKLNLIDGSPNRITIQDIQKEIDKAKSFIPNLNKLIIATSLPKDQKIEEYVRLQSVENIKNGLFPIQICFWEFFERKILEFPDVYNWYIKNEDFSREKKIEITFSNGDKEITYSPKFHKTITKFILKKTENYFDEEQMNASKLLKDAIDKFDKFDDKINFNSKIDLSNLIKTRGHSFLTSQYFEWPQILWMSLHIINIGNSVIEDFKLELDFEGDFIKVGTEKGHYLYNPNFKNNVKEYNNTKKSLYIKPIEKILVQDEYLNSGNFFLKPKTIEQTLIKLNWKFLSRDYTDSGFLTIKILPKFHTSIIEKEAESVEDDEIKISLIKRPGMQQLDGIRYFDKESDYNFV